MIAADSNLEYYICIYIYKHIPPLQILFCFIGETYTSDMWICFLSEVQGQFLKHRESPMANQHVN